MMQEDAKTHFEEILKILENLPIGEKKSLMSSDYLTSMKDFITRFKLWKPNICIYIERGVMQYVYADTDLHLHVFDDDNEQARTEEEMEPGEEPYTDKKATWEWMIESGIKDGSLKEILS